MEQSQVFKLLSPSRKGADIIPAPKQKTVKEVNKPLHPISLTPFLSKEADEFVAEEFVKLATQVTKTSEYKYPRRNRILLFNSFGSISDGLVAP